MAEVIPIGYYPTMGSFRRAVYENAERVMVASNAQNGGPVFSGPVSGLLGSKDVSVLCVRGGLAQANPERQWTASVRTQNGKFVITMYGG